MTVDRERERAEQASVSRRQGWKSSDQSDVPERSERRGRRPYAQTGCACKHRCRPELAQRPRIRPANFGRAAERAASVGRSRIIDRADRQEGMAWKRVHEIEEGRM
jgi:hypothetical protein